MEFNDVITKRASIRKYSNKSVSINHILECLEVARRAPSPDNLSIIKFVIVQDPKKIQEIADACQQPFVNDAPVLVIVCSDKKDCEKLYYERADIYVKQHVGAVIENLLLKITDLGLASSWVGAFSDETIKRVLGIPDEIDTEAVIPIAYKHKTSTEKQKEKNILDNLLYFDRWKNKAMKKPRMLRV